MMRLPVVLTTMLVALQVAPVSTAAVAFDTLDVLIRRGRVLDGSGRPAVVADVGIRDGRIVSIGQLGSRPAHRTLDATGLYVTPGFVDMHSHADGLHDAGGLHSEDPARRAAPNLVAQGITTVVVNQDGRSGWPIFGQREAVERLGAGPNVVLLVGHGTIRWEVMGGDFRRPATGEEIASMQSELRRALSEGAWGLSVGLEYDPGRWSATEELVALAEVVARNNGVCVVHQRSEGEVPLWYRPGDADADPPSVLDATRESVDIARRSQARLVITHIKARGVGAWGMSDAIIATIQKARTSGVHVWADFYPYESSGSDGSAALIPERVFDQAVGERPGGLAMARVRSAIPSEQLRMVLSDSLLRSRAERDVEHEIRRRGGADRIYVVDYPDSTSVGRSLQDLADSRGMSPVDMVFTLQLEGFGDVPGGARLRGYSINRDDMVAFERIPWTLSSSDAAIALPQDPPVHPRSYGAFIRRLSRAYRQGGESALARFVRRASMLPADVVGLTDRGRIQPGAAADVVVFDANALRDTSTFDAPHRYPDGVRFVLINGVPVVDDGELTGALPGRALARNERRAS